MRAAFGAHIAIDKNAGVRLIGFQKSRAFLRREDDGGREQRYDAESLVDKFH
jgi:hypothetical protein